MRSAGVLKGGPGDDVSAVVRARASFLAEVELERLNLQQKCLEEKGEGGEGTTKNTQRRRRGGGGMRRTEGQQN